MASRKQSRGMERIPLTLHAEMVSLLRQELSAKNEQIRRLQEQLQMALDDKFFKPEVTPKADPAQNKLASEGFDGPDQPEFDEAADKEMLGDAVDVNAAIDKIAAETGFPGTDWKKEHAG